MRGEPGSLGAAQADVDPSGPSSSVMRSDQELARDSRLLSVFPYDVRAGMDF